MSSSCPHCGATVDFVGHDTRILSGTCADCHGTFTIVEGGIPTSDSPSPSSDAAPGPPPVGRRAPSGPMLGCADCGSPLALRSTSQASIEASCPECHTTLTYTLGGAPEVRELGRRPSRSRSGDEGRRPFSPAATRPCRECGGPLRFSTAPDGTVSGECVSCGNRFTLGPRRNAGPPRRRWDDRGNESRTGGFRRYRGGGGSAGDRRGPPRYGAGPRSFRRRERPHDDDDAPDEGRRRRRPRPE